MQEQTTKKQGHPQNQFNRKAPPGKEGFNLGGIYLSWQVRIALERYLQPEEEPTKENIAKIARHILKECLEREAAY